MFGPESESESFLEVSDDRLEQQAKRPKPVILRDPLKRVNKPIGVPLDGTEDDDESFDENEEIDPDFRLNREQMKRYIESRKERDEMEQTYNMFAFSEQKMRAAKVAEGEKLGDLDPQEKRNKKLLAYKNAGNPLGDHLVDKDVDGLLYIPAKPPSTTEVDSVLGEPSAPNAFCFACTHGVGFPHMNGALVEQLERYMRELIPNSRSIQAAVKIALFYEKNIRAVVNTKLGPNDRPLPEWKPRTVYDHNRTLHVFEPSLWKRNKLLDLEELSEIIRESGMYVFEATVLESGRPPTRRDLRVNFKYHKMYMETIKMQEFLMNKDPRKAYGHNDKTSIASNVGGLVAPKHNLFGQVKITSLFNTK